jgi:glycosyltransferase involved in cell wall biosynthesis
MQAAGPVRFLNWSPGMWHRNLRMRLKRSARILASVAKLIAHGRVTNQRLYLVANSQAGLYLTLWLVFVGRRLGYTVYLHHHVYSYIDRYDWRMGWIDRCLGGHGIHVVHAEKMIRDFRNRYPTKNAFIVVHPSIIEIEIGRPRKSSHRPFRLGLLSSLSPAKGLDVAIDTFRALHKAGRDVSLKLAGPAASTSAKQLIEQTIAEHPQRVSHSGPVYDDAKAQFYANIDALVFPTMTESWGLVLNEALAAGVPVITFDRGCTATVVGSGAGLLIDPNESFVRAAASQIERWIDHEDEYRDDP